MRSSIDRLALCNTAAKIGTREIWEPRAACARNEGMLSLADAVLQRWFTPTFIAREPLVIAQLRDVLMHTDNAGYASNCDAISAADLRGDVGSIKAPTLVIAGTHDLSTTPAQGRELADAVPGACYVELDASHISNVEQGGRVHQDCARLSAGAAMNDETRYENGMTARAARCWATPTSTARLRTAWS
jgi:3-oxoadipate enol-lactonase